MRFFIDCEFMEDGRTITPLSIAIISERGNGIYLVIDDVNRELANDFVKEQVLPTIDDVAEPWSDTAQLTTLWVHRYDAGEKLRSWVEQENHSTEGEGPEFWADYGAYDWVLLCQLFGDMSQLPEGWPMFVRDIQQLRYNPEVYFSNEQAYEELPKRPNRDEHHAVSDALNVQFLYDYLTAAHERWIDSNIDGG